MSDKLSRMLVVLLLSILAACGGAGSSSSGNTGGGSGNPSASVTSFTSSASTISHGSSATVSYSASSNAIGATFVVYLSSNTSITGARTLGSWNYFSGGNISDSKTITIPSTTAAGSYYLIGEFEGFCSQNSQVVNCNDSKYIPVVVL
jgi:hypothetical protein